ncbi:MAG: hypothetical protein ACLFRG_13095 [Desulfococcaceae bacterium]
MENLIALAKKLKGFLLLAAIVFLGMALLLPKLFPGGIGDLESGDMVSVIQIVFGGFFSRYRSPVAAGLQENRTFQGGNAFRYGA